VATAVVAYPRMAPDDLAWIERIRAVHDPNAGLIAAHLTLVFPTDLDTSIVLGHVHACTRNVNAFSFVLREAVVTPATSSEPTYVFLVPREGAEAVTRLHDLLYTGVLQQEWQADPVYVPHLTVGAATDAAACAALAQTLNAEGIAIPGRIAHLDVVAIEDGTTRSTGRVALA